MYCPSQILSTCTVRPKCSVHLCDVSVCESVCHTRPRCCRHRRVLVWPSTCSDAVRRHVALTALLYVTSSRHLRVPAGSYCPREHRCQLCIRDIRAGFHFVLQCSTCSPLTTGLRSLAEIPTIRRLKWDLVSVLRDERNHVDAKVRLYYMVTKVTVSRKQTADHNQVPNFTR